MDIAPGYVGITLKPGSLIKRKANYHTDQNNGSLGQFWANSVVKVFSFFGDEPGRLQRRKVAQSEATEVNFSSPPQKKKRDSPCAEFLTAAFVGSAF